LGESEEEDMILRRNDDLRDILCGVDDLIAEHAFAQRALRRYKAATPDSRCDRRLRHPREPTQLDEHGFLIVDTCECLLLRSHGFEVGCICEHEIECPVYDLDADGRARAHVP